MWRACVRRFLAGDQVESAEVLWDIAKCFENVRHELLIHFAKIFNYPLMLLYMSLQSYRWGRYVLYQANMVIGRVYATQTIIAGSTLPSLS